MSASRGRRRIFLAVAMAALFLGSWPGLAAWGVPPDGRPLVLWLGAGPGSPLGPGEVAVTYRNGRDLAVERVSGVLRVERYVVRGQLEQIALLTSPYRGVVFNRPFLARFRAGPGVPVVTVPDQFFHHYDPELQGVKTELWKAFLADSYRQLLGRDPSEEEMRAGLHDLSRGVTLEEMSKRLAQNREAVAVRLARAGTWQGSNLVSRWRRWRLICRVLAGEGEEKR